MSIMVESLDYHKIVAAAASRTDVAIAKDDLLKIRGCRPGSKLARWIEESLLNDTLLSGEELRLSEQNSLRQESHQERPTEEGDLLTGAVPLHEDELLAAIADLDASTKVLQCQSQALETQRTLVERRSGEPATKLHGQAFVYQIEQRNLADIQRLRTDIFEVQTEIEGLLRTTRDAIDRASRRTPSTVTELLNSNDRILNDLTIEDSTGDSHEQTTSTTLNTVECLTANLSRMVAEELQTRLDRTYLGHLQESIGHVNGSNHETAIDATDLEQDLKSLYGEIPDVAQMFVLQKYEGPLLQAVREETRQRNALAALHSSRVTSQISVMTTDLEQLAKRLHTFHSYRCVIHNFQSEYDNFNTSNTTNTSSPTKAKAKPAQELHPTMERMLRHFGLYAAASGDLHESIEEKVARVRESGQVLGSSIQMDARKALESRKMLGGSLLLAIDQNDEESLSRLDALDIEITQLREIVEAISGADTSQAMRKQRAFVEKWS